MDGMHNNLSLVSADMWFFDYYNSQSLMVIHSFEEMDLL